jgi:opacity protein-like surface antigen
MTIMNRFGMRLLAIAALFVFAAAAASPAAAQVEVEVDPMAYAFSGFSLHVAKVVGSVRLNVGTFGVDVPTALHGNDGWTETMRGAGVKVDYLGADLNGLFAGVDGGYLRNRYTLSASDASEIRNVVGIGVRAGYRLPIGSRGLYLAPWVGVSYNFNGDDVAIGGDAFDRSVVRVFPTVHVGWRF